MILDSFAWIEFFNGTEKGRKVANFLLKEKCYTCLVSISEIIEWSFKNHFENKIEKHMFYIKNLSTIVDFNEDIVMLAGKLNYKRKKNVKDWGMLDSFILSTAVLNNLKILTGDEHFKDLPDVIML